VSIVVGVIAGTVLGLGAGFVVGYVKRRRMRNPRVDD
jgi:ABC-type dipeptide/oligopeptide/nickel transport system permease subunit